MFRAAPRRVHDDTTSRIPGTDIDPPHAASPEPHTHTHTHTHIYIHAYTNACTLKHTFIYTYHTEHTQANT